MPKFLDAPQWYNSNGILTNQAALSVGIVQVNYKNSSETTEVEAYFPLYQPQSELTGFANPLSFYSVLAIVAQQSLYSLCTGHLRINTTNRADISHVVFTASGDVIFRASDPTLGLGDVLGELSVGFSVTRDTRYYTATYLQGPGGAAYLN